MVNFGDNRRPTASHGLRMPALANPQAFSRDWEMSRTHLTPTRLMPQGKRCNRRPLTKGSGKPRSTLRGSTAGRQALIDEWFKSSANIVATRSGVFSTAGEGNHLNSATVLAAIEGMINIKFIK